MTKIHTKAAKYHCHSDIQILIIINNGNSWVHWPDVVGPLVWPLKSCFRLSESAVYECYFSWLFTCLQSCRIKGSSKGSDSQMWGEMLSWQKGLCSAVVFDVQLQQFQSLTLQLTHDVCPPASLSSLSVLMISTLLLTVTDRQTVGMLKTNWLRHVMR